MRKFIVIFCFSFLALSLYAAPINGIRIESDGRDIIVYIDGKQVCTPTVSCFIANLHSGQYQVEVYQSLSSHHKGSGKRGELLYKERFYYNSSTLKEITVGSGSDLHYTDLNNTMSSNAFNKFLRSLRERTFDDDRNKLVETTLVTSYFTSEQCLAISKQYTFDKERMNMMKLLYPRIVDKQNFFMVIESLTFNMDKDKMNEFVKQYHQR